MDRLESGVQGLKELGFIIMTHIRLCHHVDLGYKVEGIGCRASAKISRGSEPENTLQ